MLAVAAATLLVPGVAHAAPPAAGSMYKGRVVVAKPKSRGAITLQVVFDPAKGYGALIDSLPYKTSCRQDRRGGIRGIRYVDEGHLFGVAVPIRGERFLGRSKSRREDGALVKQKISGKFSLDGAKVTGRYRYRSRQRRAGITCKGTLKFSARRIGVEPQAPPAPQAPAEEPDPYS